MTVKIFADGADLAGMLAMAKNPLVKGSTTNPSLMRKAGVADYESFAHEVIAAIPARPISFEIFADEFGAMIAAITRGAAIVFEARDISARRPSVRAPQQRL